MVLSISGKQTQQLKRCSRSWRETILTTIETNPIYAHSLRKELVRGGMRVRTGMRCQRRIMACRSRISRIDVGARLPYQPSFHLLTIEFAVHGTNDPVARRILANHAASSGLSKPSDVSITSLYLTSVPSSHNNTDSLTSYFTPLLSNANNGLKNIVPVPATNCAFINFKTREEAENVAEQLSMRNIAPASGAEGKVKISLGDEEVGVQWGRSRKPKTASASANGSPTPAKQEQPATA